MYYLFPGRHLVTTKIQEDFLKSLQGTILFVITSANHGEFGKSRYNPFSTTLRIIGLERFGSSLTYSGIDYRILTMRHLPRTDKFAEITIKEVSNKYDISPTNTKIISAVPAVIEMYEKLGYEVIQIKHEDIVKNRDWSKLSAANLSLFEDYPEALSELEQIYANPVLEKGTSQRNYRVYGEAMLKNLTFKYDEIKDGVREGVIADEGCADGGLLVKIAQDFPDSDLFGVDLSDEFINMAAQRMQGNEFGSSYIKFYQRNLLNPVFADNSIDTTICNSTMHEIYSYGNKTESVVNYLKYKFNQLKPGGKLLIRDVIGPENPNTSCIVNFDFGRFKQDFHIPYNNSLRYACEFLLHKDYTENWDSEMIESFCHFSKSDWQNMLLFAGFKIDKLETYTSEWLYNNRLKGFDIYVDGKLFVPETNVLIYCTK